jgi:hypothetical protein
VVPQSIRWEQKDPACRIHSRWGSHVNHHRLISGYMSQCAETKSNLITVRIRRPVLARPPEPGSISQCQAIFFEPRNGTTQVLSRNHNRKNRWLRGGCEPVKKPKEGSDNPNEPEQKNE